MGEHETKEQFEQSLLAHCMKSFSLWWFIRPRWVSRRRLAEQAFEQGARVGIACTSSVVEKALQSEDTRP